MACIPRNFLILNNPCKSPLSSPLSSRSTHPSAQPPPKSITQASPFASITTLLGFTSPQIVPARCSASIVLRICCTHFSRSGCGASSAPKSNVSLPGMHSTRRPMMERLPSHATSPPSLETGKSLGKDARLNWRRVVNSLLNDCCSNAPLKWNRVSPSVSLARTEWVRKLECASWWDRALTVPIS